MTIRKGMCWTLTSLRILFSGILLLGVGIAPVFGAVPADCAPLFRTVPGAIGPERFKELEKNFGIAANEFTLTPKRGIPILVRGSDEAGLTPKLDFKNAIRDPQKYQVAVVGSGLAGTREIFELGEQGFKVLGLEADHQLGGLARGSYVTTPAGKRIEFDEGAAYYAALGTQDQKLAKRLGLGNWEKLHEIPEPIDSFLAEGKYFPGLWERPDLLKRVPKSAPVFKHVLEALGKRGLIPDQPIEFARRILPLPIRSEEFIEKHLPGILAHPKTETSIQLMKEFFDSMTPAQLVDAMPAILSKLKDRTSRKLYREYLADPKVDRAAPMKWIKDNVVDLYCRSAIGDQCHLGNSIEFANFYVAELEPRYTAKVGTGIFTEKMLERIRAQGDSVNLVSGAPVGNLKIVPDGVEIAYVKDGKTHIAKAEYVIFSAPLKLAPKVIENFSQLAPAQTEIISQLTYANYSVHNVFVKGHPWRGGYDLWIRGKDYVADFKPGVIPDPTDVINARWVDLDGYRGMRTFKKNPADDYGILTVYHPLGTHAAGSGYTRDQAIEIAEYGVTRALGIMKENLKKQLGGDIEIDFIQTNRFPASIDVTPPGAYGKLGVLNEAVGGRILFGHNNMGTPSVEEAFYRSEQASKRVTELLRKPKPAREQLLRERPVSPPEALQTPGP